MKDYSMNLDDKKLFILNYEVKDGNIIINFAGGEKNIIPYTEENESKILDKMTAQVKAASKRKYGESKKTLRDLFTIGAIGCLFFAISPLFNSDPSIATALFGTASAAFMGSSIVVNSNVKDFQKNKKFLELQNKVNTNVKKNSNMTVKTSKKTKTMVQETPENKEVFNINNFNYVPFSDIEQISENIKREEYFGFSYPTASEVITEDKVSEKPLTRKRKR